MRLGTNKIEDENNIYYIFDGSPYFPLDNFYPCTVEYEGLRYKNSEAAFQSAKHKNSMRRIPFTKMDASTSKAIGKNKRLTVLRSDWEQVKDKVMYDIVKDKMERNPEILALLLSTGDRHIEEGNTWGDEYWGVDFITREGRNQLGITLMRLREEFRSCK